MTKNLIGRVRNAVASHITAVRTAGAATAMTVVPAITAFAAEGDISSGISINFDTAQMFSFANVIITSMMPVVYITAGLGLGFMIINSLKAAFR
ncbi:hypothetical protein [Clostridium sp. AN503]|uniref:hypothetical protein n=1 Tax=Clostridium sp. AN503 TaxID=3160598 RepID=UPI00345770D5